MATHAASEAASSARLAAQERRCRSRTRHSVSVAHEPDRDRPAEVVAGFLATAAIFAGLAGIAYRPARLAVAAMTLAVVAAAMGGRHRRLAGAAVAIATASWLVGMIVAVLTDRPLY